MARDGEITGRDVGWKKQTHPIQIPVHNLEGVQERQTMANVEQLSLRQLKSNELSGRRTNCNRLTSGFLSI